MILLRRENELEDYSTQNEIFYAFKLEKYKNDYPQKIKIYINNDGWCRAYDEDALIINKLLNYTISTRSNKFNETIHSEIGFRTNVLSKVKYCLSKNSIDFVVIILSAYSQDVFFEINSSINKYDMIYNSIVNEKNSRIPDYLREQIELIEKEMDVPTITPYNHDEAVKKLTYLQNEKRILESNNQEDKSRVYREFGKVLERTVSIGDTIELSKVGSGEKEIFTIVPTTKEFIPSAIDGLDVWYKELSNTDHDLSKGEIESESKLAQILIGKELNQVIINKDENGVDSEYRITNVIKRK